MFTEHTYGEDDVFADWSMPFIEWSQVNLSGLQLEEAAELLCEKYIESVMSTRDIYESLHLDNPGLFSLIVGNMLTCCAAFTRRLHHQVPFTCCRCLPM